MNRLEGRTRKAVYAQAIKLEIAYDDFWTNEEIEILKKWYPVEGMRVLNRLVERTKSAVQTKVRKLGLKSPDRWTEEEINILKKYYSVEGYKVANRLNGRTEAAMPTSRKAKLNGKLEYDANDNLST